MIDPHTTVHATIDFGLRSHPTTSVKVRADLSYDTRDPYAVAVDFHTGRASVQWVFARSLLADGLIAAAGLGDLRITPATDHTRVIFELTSPGGTATLEASADELADFLDRTYDEIPPSEEHAWFDFDHEMSKLA
ncbi:SsgA family sporulation/cell division regulator [Kibdelosporangium persicum]|uniref:Sporulation-specific cell division protein SsgB n=1 Tax=Kibdelosporangium persicum TaxID=2698649 RepID=A0ABX2FFL1_9PSEU|nr:SsgA family sporulation/cell division regulator [Kibdelosporangium persicum]NRN70008.1 Sporulation-specific cell division protein SsgB [Kibdelosporangium persicum]